MIRDVLVYVTLGDAGERRLTYTLSLSELLGARLTGLHVRTDPEVPPVFKPSRVPEVERALQASEQSAAAEAEALFGRVAAGATTPTRWLGLNGRMADRVRERARYADLVVLGQESTELTPERNPLSLADQVVTSCGRPVVVVPRDARRLLPPKRILIAWDGSPQAVRAIHDALPLLHTADVSMVVVANPEHEHIMPDVTAGTDLIDHLSRHGLTIQAPQITRLHDSEALAILDYLKTVEVDLLVMGAYGHPAWREFLFGGATEAAIHRSAVPAFLSR